MTHTITYPPTTLEEGFSLEFTRRFFRIVGPTVAFLCRAQYSNLNNFDFSRGGIIVSNHNMGGAGFLDFFLAGHLWYNLLKRDHPLTSFSEPFLFKIWGLRWFAAKLGVKTSSVSCMRDCIKDKNWIAVTPGGNTDQMRPIKYMNKPRLGKTIYKNGKAQFKPQHWFIKPALEMGIPIYPSVVSGVHEMTPILFESKWLYFLSGLHKFQKDRHWAGFPITLNHFINLGIFLATPYSHSIAAWILFILAHLYIDLIYSYPILPTKARIDVTPPIETTGYNIDSISVKEQQAIRLAILNQIQGRMEERLNYFCKQTLIGKLFPQLFSNNKA